MSSQKKMQKEKLLLVDLKAASVNQVADHATFQNFHFLIRLFSCCWLICRFTAERCPVQTVDTPLTRVCSTFSLPPLSRLTLPDPRLVTPLGWNKLRQCKYNVDQNGLCHLQTSFGKKKSSDHHAIKTHKKIQEKTPSYPCLHNTHEALNC